MGSFRGISMVADLTTSTCVEKRRMFSTKRGNGFKMHME